MGTPHPPEKALLFTALLYSASPVMDAAVPQLREYFGDPLLESPEALWRHSRYYDQELGSPVMRRFVVFRPIFDVAALPETKLLTNDLEIRLSGGSKRKINIDPGYLTTSRVVLASAKDYSHRLYIGKGIYGEVALYYQGDRYHPMPYTYQDYRDDQGRTFFEQARRELKRLIPQLRGERDCPGVSPRLNT